MLLKQLLGKALSEAEKSPTSRLFNVAPYLFVSTRLANKYPHLMESMLVLSFCLQTPGPFSSRLKKPEVLSITRRTIKYILSFSVLGLAIALIQYIGASSLSVQRVLIHLMQPLLLACLIICLNLCYRFPAFFAIIAILLFISWALICRSKIYSRKVLPSSELIQHNPTVETFDESRESSTPMYSGKSMTACKIEPVTLPVRQLGAKVNESDDNNVEVDVSDFSDAEISEMLDAVISECSENDSDGIDYSPDISVESEEQNNCDDVFLNSRAIVLTRPAEEAVGK
jgi:hypothetical protein